MLFLNFEFKFLELVKSNRTYLYFFSKWVGKRAINTRNEFQSYNLEALNEKKKNVFFSSVFFLLNKIS